MPYLWHFPGSQDKYAIIDPFMEGEIANETFLVDKLPGMILRDVGWLSQRGLRKLSICISIQ
jgi:hypothetical protein